MFANKKTGNVRKQSKKKVTFSNKVEFICWSNPQPTYMTDEELINFYKAVNNARNIQQTSSSLNVEISIKIKKNFL